MGGGAGGGGSARLEQETWHPLLHAPLTTQPLTLRSVNSDRGLLFPKLSFLFVKCG